MSSGGWKPCSSRLRSAICDRVLVADPAGVDAVHVDAVGVVVGRRGPRHHVEGGLGHVGVRVPGGLEAPVELALHRRHVDDVLVALGRAQHQRLEPGVEDERGDGVDELGLEQLDGRHLGERQPPGVPAAQVDLLQVLVEPAAGEEVAAVLLLLGQQPDLRQLRCGRQRRGRRGEGVGAGLEQLAGAIGEEVGAAADPVVRR